MRIEGYEVQHCRAIRCPFESICRNRDFQTDRSNGCETQNFIITEAKKMEPTNFVYTPGPVIISGQGKSRIQLVKQLREETGADLKTCKDALEYANWELPRAMDYIKYGW